MEKTPLPPGYTDRPDPGGAIIDQQDRYWVETQVSPLGADSLYWAGHTSARVQASSWRMAQYMRDEISRNTGRPARIVIETTTLRLAGPYAYPTPDCTAVTLTAPGTIPPED